jgi:hypothetical protein
MAYTLRLYAPLDAGISHLQVNVFPGGVLPGSFYTENWPPAGVGTPAASYQNMAYAFTITPIMANGSASVPWRWVVNIDGAVSYRENLQTFNCQVRGTETLIQLRVEMPGSLTTFFGSVEFDANGGNLGSIKSTYNLEVPADPVGAVYVTNFTLPTEKPTRNGFVFAGWGDKATNPGVILSEGDPVPLQVSGFPPGPSYRYYAQWAKKSDGGARVHNGSAFVKSAPHVHDGISFKKAVPHVWNGGWKKGI